MRATKPVVVITGVSGGIGLATARQFSAAGWIVVGSVRGRRQTAALRAMQFDLQPAEMARPGDLERLIATAQRTYGRIDTLVCNAGYGLIGPIDSLDYPQMREQLVVNVLAPAELVRLVVPVMRRQGGGAIVGLSSLIGRHGLPGYGIYAASKFAVEGLFESLALELAAAGVRMKLVEPSGVNTTFWTHLRRGAARKWRDQELGSRLAVDIVRTDHGLSAERVAVEIFRAATDKSERLRYPLGQTGLLNLVRWLLPDVLYRRLARRFII